MFSISWDSDEAASFKWLQKYLNDTSITDVHIKKSGIGIRRNGLIQSVEDKFYTPNFPQELQRKYGMSFSIDIGGVRVRGQAIAEGTGNWEMALRILPRTVPTIEELGLPDVFRRLSSFRKGLTLYVGVPGSGKTTTQGALINEFNKTQQGHIITIEDPIEIIHHPINCMITQKEATLPFGPDTVYPADEGYQIMLEQLLREDPNLVMVAETRHPVAMEKVLTIANTGVHIMSTLHAESVASTPHRIEDMVPPEKKDMIRSELSMGLNAIIFQKLVPTKDLQGRYLLTEYAFLNDTMRTMLRNQEDQSHKIRGMISDKEREKDPGFQTLEMSAARGVVEGKLDRDMVAMHLTRRDEFLEKIKALEKGL